MASDERAAVHKPQCLCVRCEDAKLWLANHNLHVVTDADMRVLQLCAEKGRATLLAAAERTVESNNAKWAKLADECREQLGVESKARAAAEARVRELETLTADLLQHLDYCGWGDSWERECSEELRERAAAWLARRESTK